jgi:hypothetical protein
MTFRQAERDVKKSDHLQLHVNDHKCAASKSNILFQHIYALGIGIQSSSERLLLHELTESLNSFSVQFLNIRKLNEMVCLNSHFLSR